MTEELLMKIREEAQKEINKIEEYNAYAKLRNELAEVEEIKKELGLSYRRDLHMPIKTENGIILSTYRKYIREIEEEDTNGIYYYAGSYKYSDINSSEFNEFSSFDKLVDRDDPEADFRVYLNVEGTFAYNLTPEESEQFERTHIVLDGYTPSDTTYNIDWIVKDFVTTAVKENQEKAVSLVLKNYSKKR